jgi:D-alanyl-D-alanine carboxypeptidase
VAAALAVAAVAGVAPAAAQAAPAGHAAGRTQLHDDLERIVRRDHYPAGLESVRRRDGRVVNVVAGIGDRRTHQAPPVDGEVRIGSNTKTFTAVVVLQLVGEHKIDLEAPVEQYLPGLLRGDGIDGRQITVHQLLQQTTGLPNYTNFLQSGILPYQHVYFEPRDLLDKALAQKASFPPGTRFEYSNTNYLVAGLIVQAVTGRPIGEEIERRIVAPLHLRHTSFPAVGDQRIHGPHPHGYHHDRPSQPLHDVSTQDPSLGWAAGQMVASPSDLNRFFVALLQGRLLRPAQLRAMQTTVPAPSMGNGTRYGLGLMSNPLPCGGLSWGHGGDIAGYSTVNAATTDGRAATIATTELPTKQAQVDRLQAAVDRALCG